MVKFKIFVLIIFLFSPLWSFSQSQSTLWSGLSERQAVMPIGNTPAQSVVEMPYKEIPARMDEVWRVGDCGEWILSQGWTMQRNWFSKKYNAIVPGTVLTTLISQGVYPDPYYGLNNLAIPDSLSKLDWWFTFPMEYQSDIDGNLKYYLSFDGINYRSEIFFNEHYAGGTEGAFERGYFDISHLMRRGVNMIAVHIFPPDNPGIPHEQTIIEGQGLNGGSLSLDGPTFIASMGWDWMPAIRDRNMGIWQNVKFLVKGKVSIEDPYITTSLNLPDTTIAEIYFKAKVKNNGKEGVKGSLVAKIDGLPRISQKFSLSEGETKELSFTPSTFDCLRLKNPKLWWPNGYGRADLYGIKYYVIIDNEGENYDSHTISDEDSIRFGIREFSYEMMVNSEEMGNIRILYTPTKSYVGRKDDSSPILPPFDNVNRVLFDREKNIYIPKVKGNIYPILPFDDPIGVNLAIRVNGVRIFCRGGNWGMDDALKRSDRGRLEPYFGLHRDANFNIIRNWTGESSSETFYKLCDEYGMLVWNDFWITGEDTVEPDDFHLFLRNVKGCVKRFRNHPSIVIWCPRNEGFAPVELERGISKIVAEEDPCKHYHGQSRFLNMGGSGPWNFFDDNSYYFTERADGFNTEMGSFSIPTPGTIRKFIPNGDLWPINDVWAYHDLHHTTQNFSGFMERVGGSGDIDSMEEFSDRAQRVCYDSWRAMIEGWNSRMWNNTTGLILWMSHPAWPSMIWQTYTYDYQTPASYFGAKKGCEPIHIQMNLPTDEIVAINTTIDRYLRAKVEVTYFDMSGRRFYRESRGVELSPNSLTKCFIPNINVEVPDNYLIRLELRDDSGKIISINDYIRGGLKKGGCENAGPSIKLRRVSDLKYEVSIQNGGKNPIFGIKLDAIDLSTGEIVLPSYFSDGYFNLVGGEKRVIKLQLPDGYYGGDIKVIATIVYK